MFHKAHWRCSSTSQNFNISHHAPIAQANDEQLTSNGTNLGDIWRLGSWHYGVEWSALYPTVCLLLLQLPCICEYHLGSFHIVLTAEKMLLQLHTHWCIFTLHPDAQINYLKCQKAEKTWACHGRYGQVAIQGCIACHYHNISLQPRQSIEQHYFVC